MLEEKLHQRDCRVAVIGLGYVGVPLAMEVARTGFKVVGVDVDATRVEAFRNKSQELDSNQRPAEGDARSTTIDQGARSTGSSKASLTSPPASATRSITATTSFDVLAETDVVAICVPTPLTSHKEPDLSYVVDAVNEVARRLHQGQMVILESTTYPGTTEEVVLPLLEKSGLRVGKDFYLAFSPERIDPGSSHFDLRNTPKIVGGVTPDCREHAELFYRQFIEEVVTVSSPRVAETTKLLENIFRCVNIALVNELLLICDRMGIDIWEVVGAAATKPFGFTPFYPGPGLGGHCIPIDPFYLSWKAREYELPAEFIELAGKTNAAMPHHVLSKIFEILNLSGKSLREAKILILGIAYKKDIGDVRESPGLRMIELISERGAATNYHDPFVAKVKVGPRMYHSVPLDAQVLREQDCVVIITDHSDVDYELVNEQASLILDTRNVLRKHRGRPGLFIWGGA